VNEKMSTQQQLRTVNEKMAAQQQQQQLRTGCLTHGSLTQGSASRGNFASNSHSKTVPQLA
jgi:hypothetical protein